MGFLDGFYNKLEKMVKKQKEKAQKERLAMAAKYAKSLPKVVYFLSEEQAAEYWFDEVE
jgi:ribosome-associated translation inhibitor RaiA